MNPTTEQVWKEIEDNIFGVLAFTNARGEPRSAGVCYVVDGRTLLIASDAESWKVRHIAARPPISMTVTIPKRVPLLPFIKVPAAAVTFSGIAEIADADAFPKEVTAKIFRGHVLSEELKRRTRIIRVTPLGEFVTFGVAMPILRMRKVEEAQGRAPCGTTLEMAGARS